VEYFAGGAVDPLRCYSKTLRVLMHHAREGM